MDSFEFALAKAVVQNDKFLSLASLPERRCFEFVYSSPLLSSQSEQPHSSRICYLSIVSDISLNHTIYSRSTSTIYYSRVEYRISIETKGIEEEEQIDELNSKEEIQIRDELTRGTKNSETKVALIWIRDPKLLEEKHQFFANHLASGESRYLRPSSFLSPKYRKSIVVIRDGYLTDWVVPTSVKYIHDIKHSVYFDLDSSPQNNTYYSHKSYLKSEPMKSVYRDTKIIHPVTGERLIEKEIERGELGFLILCNEQSTQRVHIEGCFEFQSKEEGFSTK